MSEENENRDKNDGEKLERFSEFLGDTLNVFFELGDLLKPVKEKLNTIDENRNRILHYHLVLENVIDKVLMYQIEEYNSEELRLSFSQKLSLLPKKDKHYRNTVSGIRELNKIRNRYVHQLDYELKEKDMKEILRLFDNIDIPEMRSDRSAIEKIKFFTKFTLSLLMIYTEESDKATESFFEKYPKVEKWLKSLDLNDQPFKNLN